MSLKKDKQKVLGEFFDDERIKTFLITERNDETSDFFLLERAYRGMIAENFASFVQFFKETGKDVNGKNQYGETLLSSIQEHKQSEEYVNILKQQGAV